MKTNISQRLLSLDTLRGFDMLWITGGGAFIVSLSKANGSGWLQVLAQQMEHVRWEGFHFFDLIFPLFMFISGVAIPYAIISKKEKGAPNGDLFRKIVKRMLLLVVFGVVYNGALRNGFDNIRYASVLGQIGIAYFIAATIFIYSSKWKTRIFWLLGIMAGVALLQFTVPVPGYGAAAFSPEGSINGWLDRLLLPGRLHRSTFDPEGILCVISASVVTLTGALAGGVLRDGKEADVRKTLVLAGSGVALVIVAVLLHPVYPIIKRMWTVTYDMLAAGISLLLLSLFYFIIDVKKWHKWTFFFRVIGLNSITIYMASAMVSFYYTSQFLLGSFAGLMGSYGQVVIISGVIAIEWLLLYYLYKNKIFLRV